MNDEEIENTAIGFLRSGDFFYFERNTLFNEIQRIARNLEYINTEGDSTLANEDFLKILEIIWSYCTNGYIAPGKNSMNDWFPNAHITEKGKNFRQSSNE